MEKDWIDAPGYFLGTDSSDEWKDDYLEELSDGLQKYIKTGVKSRQLADLDNRKSDFYVNYEKCFDLRKKISDLIKGHQNQLVHKISLIATTEADDSERQKKCLMDTIKGETAEMSRSITAEIEIVIKDTAYLSNMNMILELLTRESAYRNEKAEFERDTKKFSILPEIIRTIYEHREVEVNTLKSLDYEGDKQLLPLLNLCNKYFLAKEREGKCFLRLSAKGRKYFKYLQTAEKYSAETVSGLVYKNCTKFINAVEFEQVTDLPVYMEFEGVNPDAGRALRHQYRMFMNERKSSCEGYSYKERKRDLDEKTEHGLIFTADEDNW